MAKRMVAMLVALVILSGSATAAASPSPEWPCEVPVWIEDGARLPVYARSALAQLDAATVISWPIVEDRADALLTIGWADMHAEGYAGLAVTYASEKERTRAEVWIDPSVSNRWAPYTLLHELAHVAGFDHNDEVSVMGGGPVPYRKFTAWDLAALAAVTCSG